MRKTVFLLLAVMVIGCSCSAPASSSDSKDSEGSKTLTVGFIYVGPKDDYGYNQAHAQGAAAVKTMPGVKVVEEEKATLSI